MRLSTILILLAVSISVFANTSKKFQYLAGYSNAQIIGIDHRGVQIMHDTGVCTLKVEELSDSDRKRLADEIEIVLVKQKAFKERQAKLKKQRAALEKQKKAELKKQTDAQNKAVNDLVKKFGKKGVYEILLHFENKYGLEKNSRNMGLKGRVKSVVSHIEREWPLAKKSKQSFQPTQVKVTKEETKPGKGKDAKPVKVKKTVVLATKEAPVMMNALSKLIVTKRLALEAKLLAKAAAKQKAAEKKEKKDGGEAGGEDAGADAGGDAGAGDGGGEDAE